jgi:lipopolysaccharide transport system permease protein
MVNASPALFSELVIEPRHGWQPVAFREIWHYRDVLRVLVWRDIKIRYRQTLLGGLWAVLQPLIAMAIFTFFFNRMARVASDGPPYQLFAFVGLLPWTFFSNAISLSSNSLITNQTLVSKIYFPRVFIPLGAIGALLLDLAIGLVLAFALMCYYHCPLSRALWLLPLYVGGSIAAAAGLGFLLSAVNVAYRDVKYMVPFVVQMGMFVTPVIYPISYLPARYRPYLALNPMTGMVLGFRHALLGTAVDQKLIAISLASAAVTLVGGLLVFRRMELKFADII